MKNQVKFTATKAERKIISEIVTRAQKEAKEMEIEYEPLDIHMDIEAVHSNGCPLDLEKLRDAPTFDFNHDVFGMRRYLDRRTGRLIDLFLPRCAR